MWQSSWWLLDLPHNYRALFSSKREISTILVILRTFYFREVKTMTAMTNRKACTNLLAQRKKKSPHRKSILPKLKPARTGQVRIGFLLWRQNWAQVKRAMGYKLATLPNWMMPLLQWKVLVWRDHCRFDAVYVLLEKRLGSLWPERVLGTLQVFFGCCVESVQTAAIASTMCFNPQYSKKKKRKKKLIRRKYLHKYIQYITLIFIVLEYFDLLLE